MVIFCGCILPVFTVISLFIAIAVMFHYAGRDAARLGANLGKIDADTESARIAAEMMVRFMEEGMTADGRKVDECMDAGCDGSYILEDSSDVARVVELSHKTGGRLVLRKVAGKDIEAAVNTVLKVKKRLTDLDISRAKRIELKYRR